MYGRENPLASSCCAPLSRPAPSAGVALAATSLMAMYAIPVCALDSPTPEPAPATTQAAAMTQAAAAALPAGSNPAPSGADSNEAETPDSVEQGHTQMPDSFEHRPIEALLHESRLVGLRDTTINVQFRSFYLDRDNFDDSQSQAWTLGGSGGFKTGYFADFRRARRNGLYLAASRGSAWTRTARSCCSPSSSPTPRWESSTASFG